MKIIPITKLGLIPRYGSCHDPVAVVELSLGVPWAIIASWSTVTSVKSRCFAASMTVSQTDDGILLRLRHLYAVATSVPVSLANATTVGQRLITSIKVSIPSESIDVSSSLQLDEHSNDREMENAQTFRCATGN